VRGRRFLHPKLGFTFAAPETFTLDNTAQAVIGVREGGTQAMRFDVVRVPAEQTLGDYLNSGWMEGVDKASTEDLTINGFPAASATATAISGSSRSMRCASAATSTASFSPPSRRPPRATATRAKP
jgi:predicted Zn-dependent protease